MKKNFKGSTERLAANWTIRGKYFAWEEQIEKKAKLQIFTI
jgi:hypothetical protein